MKRLRKRLETVRVLTGLLRVKTSRPWTTDVLPARLAAPLCALRRVRARPAMLAVAVSPQRRPRAAL